MKKLFLTLVIAFAGILSANAQVWVGGSLNANFKKDVNKIVVVPEIGYSFQDSHWTIAAAAKYNYSDGANKLILSPYVRYSVCNIEKFALFMDLTGDFGVSGIKGYRVGLQPGIAFMATKHWTAAFRFAFLGYNHFEYNELLNVGEYGPDGFVVDFAATAPMFGLYYNF